MKKIILSGILSSIITSTLLASPPSLLEVSPDSYGKQVFTVGFNSNSSTPNDTNITSYKIGDNVGLQLSNKATVKKLGYELGEWYWRGTGSYNLGISKDYQNIYAEIGTGLSFNMDLFYTFVDISGFYINNTYGSSDSLTGEKTSINGTGYSGSVGIGIPLGEKLDIGAFYEYGQGQKSFDSTEKNKYVESNIKIPITYKLSRYISTSINYKYGITDYNDLATPVNVKSDSVFFGWSWLYNN
jgi:hypothetical protein